MKIWFDAATPKYALFYTKLIPLFKNLGYEILVTTRFAPDYVEAKAVLDNYGIDYHLVGNYGGHTKEEKFKARLNREREFVDLFDKVGAPDGLICGCIPDSAQTAFGLGMPTFLLCDTPIGNNKFSYEKVTLVSRLALPMASLIFYPFVLPADIFVKMGLNPKNTLAYDFIDIYWWMKDLKRDDAKDFRKRYKLDLNKPTILVREEEFKAHYVTKKLPVIYDAIPLLIKNMNANVVIMPRYSPDELEKKFGKSALVLRDKLTVEEFYPFIDLLIGGGGTMNLEASCAGIPVISTRSLFLYHDDYLMDNGMMSWAGSAEKVLELAQTLIGKKRDNLKFFCKPSGSLNQIVDPIHRYLSCAV